MTIAFSLAALAAVAAWLLTRADVLRQNPFADAGFSKLTDFEGSELQATISSDGKFVAFLSDRDGSFDVWVSQVGSGAFINLTKGNPLVPTLGGPGKPVRGMENPVWTKNGRILYFHFRRRTGRRHNLFGRPRR
jgi:Tol biopolymer transport system component